MMNDAVLAEEGESESDIRLGLANDERKIFDTENSLFA